MNRVVNFLQQERKQLHIKLSLVQFLLALFPPYVGSSIRAIGMRAAGFKVGFGTVFFGTPTVVGADDIAAKLSIGDYCVIGVQSYFDLASTITIGHRVAIGPQVTMITGTHEIGSSYNRLGKLYGMPITIGDGVWIGARCTILPGVEIGYGAVVAAGAVVTRNVAPNTLVAGVPAVCKRNLDVDGEQEERRGLLLRTVAVE